MKAASPAANHDPRNCPTNEVLQRLCDAIIEDNTAVAEAIVTADDFSKWVNSRFSTNDHKHFTTLPQRAQRLPTQNTRVLTQHHNDDFRFIEHEDKAQTCMTQPKTKTPLSLFLPLASVKRKK